MPTGKLADFAAWCNSHIVGTRKDRHKSFSISEDGGGTGFADYEPVTLPVCRPVIPSRKKLMTEDCIRP